MGKETWYESPTISVTLHAYREIPRCARDDGFSGSRLPSAPLGTEQGRARTFTDGENLKFEMADFRNKEAEKEYPTKNIQC